MSSRSSQAITSEKKRFFYAETDYSPDSRRLRFLVPNSESPGTAHEYWHEVRQRLRQRFELTRFESGPDLRLNHYYYPRVKAFIQRELQCIEEMMKDPVSTLAPTATESDGNP